MGAKDVKTMNPLLDKAFVNAFVDGVTETISLMAETKATVGKVFVEQQFKARGDVAGLIGMVAGQFKGNLTVSFEKEAAFHILKAMLDEEYTEINEEVGDAIGEVTNQVYGWAKAKLNQLGYAFEMAIPMVVLGKNICSKHTSPTLVIPLTIDETGGKFYVEITIA